MLPMSSGYQYFLLIIDDYSCYMWLYLLPSKDVTPATIKRIQAVVVHKIRKKLYALRMDRGGEVITTNFIDYFAKLGVRHELTVPYSP